jgi:hypothetical protein
VDLPKGVHRVVSRGREYFYWSPGRGTPHAVKPIPIRPNGRHVEPDDPAFWMELRRLQGMTGPHVKTFGDVCDLYVSSPAFVKLGKGTKAQYARAIRIARAGFEKLPAESMRASLIRAVVEGLADKPGAANNFLGTMRALSEWAVVRDHFPASITKGVKPYEKTGGHRPWTAAQLGAAEANLTGMVRRAWFLLRYTGQRGSDIVRLGETFVDDGGFRLSQQKTGREVWIPIEDALAVEMATWDRRPGPYLWQDQGRRKGAAYTRKLLDEHFAEQRARIPELARCTLHGLRSTRVVELRMHGLTELQIEDQVGMSAAMIRRYCRFADRKASGKASVIALAERRRNGGL